MSESEVIEQKLTKFGRSFALLFNRATIYEADHPFFVKSIDEFELVIQDLVESISPLVFIMNQEQFFVDEEPLDPRLNTSRMLAYFKNAEIQSISFYKGIDRKEIKTLADVFTSIRKYPDYQTIQKDFHHQGIKHLRINHVFFKKVAKDEEVISRHTLSELSPHLTDDAQLNSKKKFLEMVLESVLAEEIEKTLTIKNLVNNPVGLSKNMVNVDFAEFRRSDAEDAQPGLLLVHQLQIIDEKVDENLSGKGAINLSELAQAVLDMKRQLSEDIETQKALGITYSNEEMILDKANEVTDKVMIRLVKDEYKSGQTSIARLAQILRRLVPEADELKRLLPKIKTALLEEGMPLSEYLTLTQELAQELQGEEISKVLHESAEMIGVEGEGLIEQIRGNPVQAAELIFLAAEIRKNTGDETELSDILIDYVEQIGAKLTLDIARRDQVREENDLREVMDGIESTIVTRLKNMDIKSDVLESLEEKLNNRIDEIFERIKSDWLSSQSERPERENRNDLSVLGILEKSVDENEELGKILKNICSDVQSKRIDENDLGKIYTEIVGQHQRKSERKKRISMPPGILSPKSLHFLIDKEISRSSRYNLPFSALSFCVVSAKPAEQASPQAMKHQSIIEGIVRKLSYNVRGPDLAGQLGKNKVVVLLPMTSKPEAKFALTRHLKILNTEPVEVTGIPIEVKIAGAATSFEPDRMADADTFLKILSAELSEMAIRIKNIHNL